MPGWWFTIESTTTRHFLQQLKTAVENALRSKPDVRAIMRARATKQRFPVSQWVEDLEKLQSSAIEISHKQAAREKRPTFDSPNTSTILETPSTLNVLQTGVPSSKLPRSAVVQSVNQGGFLSTVSEARPYSDMSQISDQGKVLSSFSEGRLLTGASAGLGSKIGPSSRRKAPPALLLDSTTKTDVTAVRSQSDEEANDRSQRPPIPRSPSSPNPSTRFTLAEGGIDARPRPNTIRLRPNDRKAVRLLGMQISSSRARALQSPKPHPESSDESSLQSPCTPKTPVTPEFGYYTPPRTRTPPRSRMSIARFSFPASSIAATSISGDVSVSGGISDTTATSLSASSSSSAISCVKEAKPNIIRTHAVDSFPSLGPHYFPHGGITVLRTSDVKEGSSESILQNLTPFFSDPEQRYEDKFKEKIRALNGKNSEHRLCIEEFLLESEKSWFAKLRAAELRKASLAGAPNQRQEVAKKKAIRDEFGLGDKHKPPTGLKRVLRINIGEWPVYSFLLAFVRKSTPASNKRLIVLTSKYS